jgi:hypothetical protein
MVCLLFLWQSFAQRNVQFDAFSRLYEAYIKRKLDAGLEGARLKSEGHVQVEPSGDALLRTICKLTHIGPKRYAKGKTFVFIGHYICLFIVWSKYSPPRKFPYIF